jgi:phosphate uptake regulator
MPSHGNNEVRRIQFTGRSTYILSLPKKWINEMNLKAGDLVNLFLFHQIILILNKSAIQKVSELISVYDGGHFNVP